MSSHQPAGSIAKIGTTTKGNPLYRHRGTDHTVQYLTTYQDGSRDGAQMVKVVRAMSDGLQLGTLMHSHPRCPGRSLGECRDHALTEWLTVQTLHRQGKTHDLLTRAWKVTPQD